MNASTVFFPLAFLAIAACLGWILAKAKGHWAPKVVLVAIAAGSSIGIWFSLQDVEGWPVSGPPPETFEMHCALIREPTPAEPGMIYLWATPDHGRSEKREPRAYAIPYSKPLHEEMSKAMKDIKKGRRIMGKLKRSMAGQDQGKEKGGEGGQPRPRGMANYKYDAEFWYPLPPGGASKLAPEEGQQ